MGLPRAIGRAQHPFADQAHQEYSMQLTAVRLLESMDLDNMRVIERGEHLRLALETRCTLGSCAK
jgi:hypothetical protein